LTFNVKEELGYDVNVKLELGLNINVKLESINLQFNFQGLPESRLGLGLDVDVELGPVNYGLTWKSFWI